MQLDLAVPIVAIAFAAVMVIMLIRLAWKNAVIAGVLRRAEEDCSPELWKVFCER